MVVEKRLKYSPESVVLYLNKGKVDAFEQIYQSYWSELYSYAYNILRDKAVCEEIVQEIFFSLWNKRREIQITHSIRAYLFTAVKFQTLNYIKSEKVKRNYAASYGAFKKILFDNSNEENIHLADLKNLVENEVSKLPEKCQQIFRMSRNEHHSIKNIADLLNISHKTVENQLSKALKQLRSSLGQLFSLLILVLFAL